MNHAHHWVMESGNVSTFGTCKHCGERRWFEGHVEYSYREINECYYENVRRDWAQGLAGYTPAPYVLPVY